MSISKLLSNISQYISEAVARIFGPSDDEYPATGVQPFECETYQEAPKAE
ncbi:MAG: hypothetical protein DSM107014_14450 [Gomphosphaeria aponina SAG 52.96 = DSM 107014]|uniref:Isochorismate synthase n=1 Tax=Gomphosphaeria aponina SAG 52.96 = DSM 107014 TaxID=1521640 RepID=A0A941JSV7_9CHRO|nr:hypothetical protein [Gomphosphaeria aponina SAG 52.96 = DSM 107014]